MTKINLERRAEIGRERRAQTRAQILKAAEKLLSERPAAAVTVDSLVLAAGVAKGTFYYHFQSMDELVAAVGEKLADSFDEMLAPELMAIADPVLRLSFAFTRFLHKAIADPVWARLVVQNAQSPAVFGRGIRAHLKTDLEQAIREGRVSLEDADLAADIVIGIWVQVARGTLERPPASGLVDQTLAALHRALGVKDR